MKTYSPFALAALLAMGGCTALSPPSAEQLERLPVVTYPDMPAAGQAYIYKLPANQPVSVRVRADGSALTTSVEQSINANLGRDIYLYKNWASDDGRHWVWADALMDVHLQVALPSHEAPGPGDIHLTVNRKQP